MKTNIKKITSIFLSVLLIANLSTIAFANSNNRTPVSYLGDGYTIQQEETKTIRTSYLYDDSGNLVDTLIFNKETGVLYNPNNSNYIALQSDELQIFEPCQVTSDKDYEYELCSLGETYTSSYTETVGTITGMITTTVAVSSIIFVIAGIGGIGALTSAMQTKIGRLASSIYALYTVGSTDHEVEFTFRYKCIEVWESDPFYPNGGFWFLGYMPDQSYFAYEA